MGWTQCDGIGTPGGSTANFMAVLLARHQCFPQIKQKGMRCIDQDLKILSSNQCHYSMSKACIIAGLGSDAIVKVKCDEEGRMIPEELEKAYQQCLADGHKVIMVNATVGTTVYGAIDPIGPIGDFCEKYKIWFHIDGALAGPAIFTPSMQDQM